MPIDPLILLHASREHYRRKAKDLALEARGYDVEEYINEKTEHLNIWAGLLDEINDLPELPEVN